jgi:IclR family transcriptional regulator, KDG regulon repressor
MLSTMLSRSKFNFSAVIERKSRRCIIRPVDTMPRSRYIQRNQGAERVSQILELLSLAARPLSLQELSQSLDLHASTAHRLLKTLEDEGLIARPDGTELYRLGPTILRLSTRMLSQFPVRDVASPYLYRLASDLSLTVSLSKYEDGYVTYLDCKESPEPIHIVLRAGGTAPAHCIPSGWVQLSYLGDAEVDRLAERGLCPYGSGTPVDLNELKQHLKTVRQQGYATGGDWLPGVDGVAVALLDSSDRPLAAISVIAFAGQIVPARVPSMVAAMQHAADEIAAQLGHAPAHPRSGPRPLTDPTNH